MIPQPTDAHARWAAERWPGTTRVDLDRGRALYVRKCGSCHALHRPTEVVHGDWPANLEEMARKAHLLPEEETLIGHYLEAAAAIHGSSPAKATADTASPGQRGGPLWPRPTRGAI